MREIKQLCLIALSSVVLAKFALAALPTQINGLQISDGRRISVSAANKKATVVVFLSATCPCSHSHITELNALAHQYPDFSFVGVHSNQDESSIVARNYFKKVNLAFPVITDPKAELANVFRALKTPHAFVVLPDGTNAYRGGVSSSRNVQRADRKHLREALKDIVAGHTVRIPEGRTLGCVISRGG